MTQPIRIHGNNRGSWSDFSCGAHADAAEALGHPHDHHDHLGVPSPFLAPSLPNGFSAEASAAAVRSYLGARPGSAPGVAPLFGRPPLVKSSLGQAHLPVVARRHSCDEAAAPSPWEVITKAERVRAASALGSGFATAPSVATSEASTASETSPGRVSTPRTSVPDMAASPKRRGSEGAGPSPRADAADTLGTMSPRRHDTMRMLVRNESPAPCFLDTDSRPSHQAAHPYP